MTTSPHSASLHRFEQVLARLVPAAGVLAVLVASLALSGWALDSRLLVRFVPLPGAGLMTSHFSARLPRCVGPGPHPLGYLTAFALLGILVLLGPITGFSVLSLVAIGLTVAILRRLSWTCTA